MTNPIENFQILDTTLRETLQAQHPRHQDRAVIFDIDQRLVIADLLEQFGVDYIEIGAPVGSATALEAARAIVYLVEQSPTTQVLAHARCHEDDIKESLNAGVTGINLFIGTSPQNRAGNKGRSLDTTIQMAHEAIDYIRARSPDMFIRFSTEDAFRTDINDLLHVLESIAPKVERIGLPDTTGNATPWDVYNLVTAVRQKLGDKEIEFHAHNDRSFAEANCLAAFKAGAKVFDTTILGLGERNGIASLPGLIAAIGQEVGIDKLADKYNLTLLSDITQRVADYLEIPLPHNLPIVSPNAFTHTAGVHASAQIHEDTAYLSLNPGVFGAVERFIYYSSVVGKEAIKYRAAELGIDLSTDGCNEVAKAIRTLATRHEEKPLTVVDDLINDQASRERRTRARSKAKAVKRRIWLNKLYF